MRCNAIAIAIAPLTERETCIPQISGLGEQLSRWRMKDGVSAEAVVTSETTGTTTQKKRKRPSESKRNVMHIYEPIDASEPVFWSTGYMHPKHGP